MVSMKTSVKINPETKRLLAYYRLDNRLASADAAILDLLQKVEGGGTPDGT